ncbi:MULTISPECIES: PadR family transcriptional regulator [Paenibacillus]|uniref:PadR family transcriptional regulator n=1 Tax=Paenibacillus woosongensis TaxID=307580 RepID=A0A7X2Z2I8_9BACL|nr:PadR family transcriptional regulator [Paenibacillus woosongensis]MUG46281.1 PadR family transcriptional regulator [Paenibacillus woosongensis]
MNIQFKKGVLELCVLVLTAKKDRYGYELVEQISQRFEIAEGTIYPLLRRLAAEGLFSTYLHESMEGPPRKYYKITEQGREVMNELVSEWSKFAVGVQEMIEEGLR